MTRLPWALVALVCSAILLIISCDTCDTCGGDGESAEPETVHVPLAMASWVPASPPADYEWQDTRMMWWYLKDREVLEEDILPGAGSAPGQSFIPVLEMDIRGFRHTPEDEERGWAGIQHLISETGENLTKYEFVEVWLRQKQGEGGTIYIEVGDVSENFYRPWSPDSLHTEDKDGDGELSWPENTGYDGLFDGLPGDDPYDDYYYHESDPDSVRYSHINGTEKDPKRVPDTEDMDGDGMLDTEQVHFRFSLDVSDTAHVAHSHGGWVIYRVPLSEAEERGGRPKWSSVRYVRVFFTGVEVSDRFQLASLCFADSSWADYLEPLINPAGGN